MSLDISGNVNWVLIVEKEVHNFHLVIYPSPTTFRYARRYFKRSANCASYGIRFRNEESGS